MYVYSCILLISILHRHRRSKRCIFRIKIFRRKEKKSCPNTRTRFIIILYTYTANVVSSGIQTEVTLYTLGSYVGFLYVVPLRQASLQGVLGEIINRINGTDRADYYAIYSQNKSSRPRVQRQFCI